MKKLQFISKNLLIAGETGSGKTYLLTYLINQILEEYDKNPIIFIYDFKGFDYRKKINNINIFKYNEAEIFKLIDYRLKKIKDDHASNFREVYVIFDELVDALESSGDLTKKKFNKNRKLSNRFINFFNTSVSKKIKVYMICATQLPNLFLPNEIQSRFDFYIDTFCDSNMNNNKQYSYLLKSELHSSFNEVFHTKFDDRYLTVYKIEKRKTNKYIVKVNNEIVLETYNYMLGYSNFIDEVKKIIQFNFGFFGDVGLPYSLEAYLCLDDEICNNEKLTKKADDILNLFKHIQVLDGSSFNKKNIKDIKLSEEEWNFELNAKDAIVKITSYDDIHYLKTNIFNNLNETSRLYFKFCLEKVVSEPEDISKLGDEMKYEITIKKID